MQCIMNSCLYDGAVAIFMPKYQLKDFLHACQRTKPLLCGLTAKKREERRAGEQKELEEQLGH